MSQTPAAHDYGLLLLLFLYQKKIDLLIVICKQASTDTYYTVLCLYLLVNIHMRS